MNPYAFATSALTSGLVSVLEHYSSVFLLGIVGFIILALGIFRINKKITAGITFAAMAISLPLLYFTTTGPAVSMFGGTIIFNNFGTYFAMVMVISSMFIVFPALQKINLKSEVFYALLLFITVGMIIAAFSYNIITIFIAFESVSIGTYVLASFGKDRRTLEASIKYFFTGTVGTAFIIFGASFFFMATSTFNLVGITHVNSSQAFLIAMAFLIIGFGFKMALFPLHQWALDTYDGTENSVSAFLSSGTKILAFLIILRVFLVGFSSDLQSVYYFFVIIAILTMTYGNIAALSQTNLKRILGYSSIAQAGYLILVVVIVAYSSTSGLGTSVIDFAIAAGMFYSLVYIFMKGGAFITMNVISKEKIELSDISGLAKRSPATAVSFAIILLALAGIPLTGGFMAKYYLFIALISGQLWWLAIIAILNSAISVFYYLRIIQQMFWKEPLEGETFNLTTWTKSPVIISAIIVVALGLLYAMFPVLISTAGGLFG